MDYIYVDNYRGFSKTFVPIAKTNFLVGENSTGKTSILGLIQMFSEKEFWFETELDFRKSGFTTFKDIVSIESKNKKSFTIGMIYSKTNESSGKKNKEPSEYYNYVIIQFVEREGVPKIARTLISINGYELHLKKTPSNTMYKYKKSERYTTAEELVDGNFLRIISSADDDNKGFKKLTPFGLSFSDVPLILQVDFVESEIAKREKGFKRSRFDVSSVFGEMAWLAPIRTKPRKTYDEYSLDFTPEGNHTPYLIKKKLDGTKSSEKFKTFVSEFGKKSGLFKNVQIKSYSKGATDPFELDVVLNNKPLSINSVGYGVSQVLPVIVEMFSRSEGSWFAIQQPEVHLHPKAQAALGEFIFGMSMFENKKFVIETHSDYLIDRYRIMLKKNKEEDKNINSQVLFFERTKDGNKVSAIQIKNNGELSDNQPESYREFFMKEELALLGF